MSNDKGKQMTELKCIWHNADETPRQESRVLWKSGNVVRGGRFDTYYKCFCGPASQFVDLKKVSRWAYVDDLLACEKELADTKNKLDIAINAINSAVNHNIINCVVRGIDPRTDDTNVTLCNALEQIYRKER